MLRAPGCQVPGDVCGEDWAVLTWAPQVYYGEWMDQAADTQEVGLQEK